MCVFKCTWVYKIQECVYSSVPGCIKYRKCVYSSVPGCIKYRKWNVCIQVYLGV